MQKKEVRSRLKDIYSALLRAYGSQGWWPIVNSKSFLCEYHVGAPRNDEDVFEICISSILAQNTQYYPNVVRAIQQLKLGRQFIPRELEAIKKAELLKDRINSPSGKRSTSRKSLWVSVDTALLHMKKFRTMTPENLLLLSDGVISQLIRPAGYHNQKAKKIKIFAQFFQKIEQVPKRDKLLCIWGVGRETADSMLLYAFKVPVFVVDEYTKRVFGRIGIINERKPYDDIQDLLQKNIKPDLFIYQEAHALIVEHAKRYCRQKPSCKECPVNKYCDYFQSLKFKKK